MSQSNAFGDQAAPDIPADLEWINSGRPLTMADLRGRLIILHFWTYA